GLDSLPLNGRVWYPDGDGPFPLVLIVHGNHNPENFSDPGYEYLGRLLASRGFILASIDENFLNGNMRGENDARGWMLLKHLEAWKAFSDSAGRPFYHKIDWDKLALMGHSRGGEAVADAGLFNRLEHYPDDANVKFKFNFNIKSLVAIAPVDGQYEPASRPTPLSNYNYLVIHGSHDGDVSSFSGMRQYERVAFTDTTPHFKAAVWMYRANHGQWNTSWGSNDAGQGGRRFLDLRGLIAPELQREMAEIFITSFLEATLNGKKEYFPLFRDHRVAGGWLPKTMYITRFQESGFHALADYHEDVDVTTGSAPGVTIAAESLSTWKEAPVPLRQRNANMGFNAAWLGWNNHIAGDDTTKFGTPASYDVTISDSLRTAWHVTAQGVLELSLAPTKDKPGPRKAPRDTTKKDTTKSKTPAPKKPPPPKPNPEADTLPIDLSIQAIDAAGDTARVDLGRYGAIRRPLEMTVLKRRGQDQENFPTLYELILQTYVIPLADFVAAEPKFDPSRLKTVRILFDRTPQGTVVLSDIGLSAIDPAFLTAANPGASR
ncbi:MAG TPA: hypothetical protein VGI83_01160, partial [Gemmatimonadales bacterium]